MDNRIIRIFKDPRKSILFYVRELDMEDLRKYLTVEEVAKKLDIAV